MALGAIAYCESGLPFISCEQRHTRGGSALDSMAVADTDTATLAWLVSALEGARAQGQSKSVAYLDAVADNVVFEVGSVARGSPRASYSLDTCMVMSTCYTLYVTWEGTNGGLMSETGQPDQDNREKLATATEADVIEELRKQGIYDLDDLVRKALADIQNQLETESESELDALLGPWYVYVHSTEHH